MRFRDDILRGVRLFAIVFAGILICVAAYRTFRTPLEAHSAPPAPDVAEPPADSTGDSAPASESAPEFRPAVVVPPPPEIKAPPHAASRIQASRNGDVPPPPPAAPVTRARRAPTPSGRDFEFSQPVALPAAPVAEASQPAAPGPRQVVGYKSLLEADPNRAPAQPIVAGSSDEPDEKPKGNRFLHAIGKIFHPGKQDQ